MQTKLTVWVNNRTSGVLEREAKEILFSYTSEEPAQAVSLTMPVRSKNYALPYLMPIFEMHLPEGYLLSVIKKHFSKLTATDDFGLLALLAPSQQGRLTYQEQPVAPQTGLTLDTLLHNQEKDLFQSLVVRFALSSPLSGVQPKVLATVEDKATLAYEDIIVKTWGDDYPELALNEYLCMSAVRLAGIVVPEFFLSDDERLFMMRRFDRNADGTGLGFEDMCVLQAKRRDDKYQGSYEQLAKTIKTFVSPAHRQTALLQYFKMMVMNHWLQNGDAHLKNFGVLYTDAHNVWLAPAFDVVSTSFYLPQDMMALTLQGTKRWQSKTALLRFATEGCDLTLKQANTALDACHHAMLSMASMVKERLNHETHQHKRHLLAHFVQLVERLD
jgi:serine/threonine-protein kinase HipA